MFTLLPKPDNVTFKSSPKPLTNKDSGVHYRTPSGGARPPCLILKIGLLNICRRNPRNWLKRVFANPLKKSVQSTSRSIATRARCGWPVANQFMVRAIHWTVEYVKRNEKGCQTQDSCQFNALLSVLCHVVPKLVLLLLLQLHSLSFSGSFLTDN